MNSNGILVRGVCVSSTATAGKRKDGSGMFVIAREEFALQPGVAILSKYYEGTDPRVAINGDRVTKYPKLTEFKTYELKVNRFKTNHEGQLVISDAEIKEVDDPK